MGLLNVVFLEDFVILKCKKDIYLQQWINQISGHPCFCKKKKELQFFVFLKIQLQSFLKIFQNMHVF